MGTKTEIKARFIALIKVRYPFYTEGSRSLALANDAANAALAGKIKLEGECWEQAVKEVSGLSRWTMRQLSELPE
jgi:hypothetical protein